MATMQFRVSRDEFTKIVEALQRKCVVGEIQGVEWLENDEDKVEEIVDFIQEFMIDTENECVLGFYDYELVLGEETIQLDENENDERLKELVKVAMVPWESIKI